MKWSIFVSPSDGRPRLHQLVQGQTTFGRSSSNERAPSAKVARP